MDKDDLIVYEMPAIAEFISIGWLQDIMAGYLARKVNRKMRRFKKRKEIEEYLKKVLQA